MGARNRYTGDTEPMTITDPGQRRSKSAEPPNDRLEQFVSAATTLFASVGYHETTVKEIAEEAGASPGLIYTYVKNKEELLLFVLIKVLERYKAEVPAAMAAHEDPLRRFIAAFETYCRIAAAEPEAILLAYRYTATLPPQMLDQVKEMEVETNAYIADCISECIEAGHFRSVNVEVAAYRLVMIAHGWAQKRWRLSRLLTIEEYISESLDFFLAGLLTQAGRQRHLGVMQGLGT